MQEERNGFSIIGFIAQVLVILLFVFILLWLFPTKSYIEKNDDNNATNILLFNQNLLSMKDAGREYFTKDKMPAKEGDNVTLTLEKMLEKSMVVSLTDANDNKCDVNASYVKVTKIGNEYVMDVVLTCSGITKKISTTIGCYDYCIDNLCEKSEQILYEYKKITDATKSWSTWSTWSKTKVTGNSTKEVETKIVKEPAIVTAEKEATVSYTYSCPSGYNLSSDKKTCTKTNNSTSVVASTLSCPSGYKMNSAKTVCTKTNYAYADKVAVYACSDPSYTLSGSTCYKTITTNAIPHIDVSFDCDLGPCQTISTIDYYYCNDLSYTLSGKTCTKNLTAESYISNYTCPSGYKMNSAETRCYKTTNVTTDIVYSCGTSYTLSADKKTCTTIISSIGTATPITESNYSCATGELNKNNKCNVTSTSYTEVTLYRFRILKTTDAKTYIKWSTLANDTKLIKEGYKKTGVTKVKLVENCSTDCSK